MESEACQRRSLLGWLVQLLQQLSKAQPHMGTTCAQPDTAGTDTPHRASSLIPKKFPPTGTQQDPQGPTGSGVRWKLWDGAGNGDSTNPV